MSFILLTNNEYDRARLRSAGLVNATHVEAVSSMRGFAADLLGAFGNKSDLLTKKTDDAIAAATQELIQRARAQFPAAVGVCDIRYNLSGINPEPNKSFILVCVSGTVLVPGTGARCGLRKKGKTVKNLRSVC